MAPWGRVALATAVTFIAGCGPNAIEVSTVDVEPATVVRTIGAPAIVDAVVSVEVRAPVSGVVAALPVVDGGGVAAGAPLLVLTSDTVELQLAQAQAALESADALVGAAGALNGDLSPLIGALRIQLDTTFPAVIAGVTAQIELAEATGGLVDPDTRAAAAEARTQLRSLEDGFAQARNDLAALETNARRQAARTSGFQRSAAQAQRLQAELALRAAQTRANQLTIFAPISGQLEFGDRQTAAPSVDLDGLSAGVLGPLGGFDFGGLLNGGTGAPAVSGLPLAIGQEVRSGEHLMSIFDTSRFIVRLDVDELDIVDVAIGQTVTVRIDALPDSTMTGRVTAIAQSPQRRGALGATYAVTVDLDSTSGMPLRIGMTAAAEIEVERLEAALTVPTVALLRRGELDVVRVVVDGLVRDIEVNVVLIGDERAVISGAIPSGRRVIVGGLAEVVDGDRARDLTATR